MTRRWIPTDWLDEMVTGMSEDPNAFLKRTPEGVLQLHPIDQSDDPEFEWRVKTLEPGELVELSYTEDFGEGTLTVFEDGTWTCDRTFPPEATHFWLPFDPSTMTDSIGDLVAGDGDMGVPEPLQAGTHTIGAYMWSGPIKHQVRIRDTGEAEFEQVGSA